MVNMQTLSLAICKRSIRKNAQKDDWIYVFGSVLKYQFRLIAIFEVTKKLPLHEYYTDPQYAHRRDCIYEDDANGNPVIKPQANYHREDYSNLLYDVGVNWEKSFILLSTNFRYLGAKGTNNYSAILKPWVRALGTGAPYKAESRPAGVTDDLEALRAAIWQQYPYKKEVGSPSTHRSPNYWRTRLTWAQAGRTGIRGMP
jgi:hypothetical protein